MNKHYMNLGQYNNRHVTKHVNLISEASLIYDRPKLFCGLLFCFPEQLLIMGEESVLCHGCLYDRV